MVESSHELSDVALQPPLRISVSLRGNSQPCAVFIRTLGNYANVEAIMLQPCVEQKHSQSQLRDEPGVVTQPKNGGRDKIAQAYLGLWGSDITQQRARARVDWMASAVEGTRVLDIGCSEGILAILLARRGHDVVGIDVEDSALAYARNLLAAEPAAVSERVRLVVDDALTADLGEAPFDTVVIGEVLEHLSKPSDMLETARNFLKPDGRLVLTTPFGYFPHPDHRQEFRSSELAELISDGFLIQDFSIVDGYIRVLARAAGDREHNSAKPNLEQLLSATEEAAVAIQKDFYKIRLELSREKRIAAEARSRLQRTEARMQQYRDGRCRDLGRVVEKSLSSPWQMLRLPFRIAKVCRRWRQRAKDAPSSASDGPTPSHRAPATATSAATTVNVVPRQDSGSTPHRDLSSAFPPYELPDRPPRTSLTVATILDEFSDCCFRYEANLARLTKESWRSQMEEARPSFLLVESAWKGNKANWRRLITNANDKNNPLDDLIGYCKEQSIPTVFWNKEDPPNFAVFIDAAAKFDYVFTTDANCCERYRARLGHDNVFPLPFAAQPMIHNPVGKRESDDYEVAFAGTWYGQKHVERAALLPLLLDPAMDYKLHIFDRMSEHTQNDHHKFPEQYGPYLRKALPYANILTAYRNFEVFLNVNSVIDSPTMFARRVFEVLASSTAVVSTASLAIEQMLGNVVSVVNDEDETKAELERLLTDRCYRQSKVQAGYRKVMREHTYARRFQTIAQTIGLVLDDLDQEPLVSILLPLGDHSSLHNSLSNLRRQLYPQLEVVLIVQSGARHRAEGVFAEWPQAKIVEVATNASTEAMLEAGIGEASGVLVTIFDELSVYGEEFVRDLVLAFDYADADIVGKASHFAAAGSNDEGAAPYSYVQHVPAAAMLARRQLFEQVPVHRVFRHERPDLIIAAGTDRIYSADPFNYLRLSPPDLSKIPQNKIDATRQCFEDLKCHHIMI